MQRHSLGVTNMSEEKKQFINLASKYGKAVDEWDFKVSNSCDKKLKAIGEKIDKNNKVALLKELLKHKDESVQLWAALFMLEHDAQNALEVLEEVKKCSRVIASYAEAIIDVEEKKRVGKWEFVTSSSE